VTNPRKGLCFKPSIKAKTYLLGFVLAVSGSFVFARPQAAGQEMRRFTISDDVELTRFGNVVSTPPVTFSPDGKYFVVASERGRLDINRPESSLRIYRTEDVSRFLFESSATDEPLPFWTVKESSYKDGPIITGIRWLVDSSGLAFVSKTSSGNNQLFLADIQSKSLASLTPEDQDVTAYDLRSRSRFAYTLLSPAVRGNDVEEKNAPAFVGTGRTLSSIVYPEQSGSQSVWVHDLSELWVVVDGKRARITGDLSGRPLPIHLEGQLALALSPDGRTVATALSVSTIPPEWEILYAPAVPSSAFRISAGHQSPESINGQRDVSEYVLIDVATGKITHLIHAPIGDAAGWWGATHTDWAADGQSLVFSNTFVPMNAQDSPGESNRPCVAVAALATGRLTCVEQLEADIPGGGSRGWKYIYDAHFTNGNSERVLVEYSRGVDGVGTTVYDRAPDGTWHRAPEAKESRPASNSIEVEVKQDLNNAPVVVATDKRTERSRRIWNPNPVFSEIKMGEEVRLAWKDKTGRDWVGGLYKPPDYVVGKRYPLVIQTHGFIDHEFRPSGTFTTAFAAQELAAAGFLVLQVSDCPIRDTEDEGPCQVRGYEAAVDELAAGGLVDPDRVGVVGFSRTCYYVLEALTTSRLHFRAASIIDGFTVGYLQYILDIDADGNSIEREADAMIGASPFGVGLGQWFEKSPGFNMDQVTTPLQVMATRKSVLQMWEPYSILRYLEKPVDLLILNSDEHVFTTPAERVVSENSVVDWFCFWLQDKEDPDPSKLPQYARWRRLRALRTQDRRSSQRTGRNSQ
jgi:WD40 repeat protein